MWREQVGVTAGREAFSFPLSPSLSFTHAHTTPHPQWCSKQTHCRRKTNTIHTLVQWVLLLLYFLYLITPTLSIQLIAEEEGEDIAGIWLRIFSWKTSLWRTPPSSSVGSAAGEWHVVCRSALLPGCASMFEYMSPPMNILMHHQRLMKLIW